MRPKTILAFEGLMIGTLILGLVQLTLIWNRQMLQMSAITKHPAAAMLSVVGFMTALMLTLTLLVSRRRSRVAAGILIALFVIGIPSYVRMLLNGAAFGYTGLSAIQIVGQFVAYALLFAPPSRAWFRRRPDENDLRETFS